MEIIKFHLCIETTFLDFDHLCVYRYDNWESDVEAKRTANRWSDSDLDDR